MELDKKNTRKEQRYVNDIESTGIFISEILKKNKTYTETYKLNDKYEIDSGSIITENSGRNILEMVKSVDISIDGLGNLISDVVKKIPNIKFSVNIKDGYLTIDFENKIKEGIMVNWVSQDTNQWDQPRKITNMSEDGQWAFVEGSSTGIPISQLELAD